MTHLSEESTKLSVEHIAVHNREGLLEATKGFTDVCILRLPASGPGQYNQRLDDVEELVSKVAAGLDQQATLITLGEVVDLIKAHVAASTYMRYQQWIAIKRDSPQPDEDQQKLPQYHFGALVHTGYKGSLKHTKTRIQYTYCPTCDKTTKDYGGKKHTYHEYGTLISDVWRDISCDLAGDIALITERFADLFGLEPYKVLRVIDCQPLGLQRTSIQPTVSPSKSEENVLPPNLRNTLLLGDCLEQLRKFPDNSIDFAFADPPYNLGKKYLTYADDLQITEYFSWCDEWISELARVIKPGRTCAILNIPLWAIRHFLHMEKILNFQCWIAWDALAYPVRLIMPAHYTILCFSKGTPRELPGLTGEAGKTNAPGSPETFESLEPLAENFCLRADCVRERKALQIDDRGPLTDLWWDIHRLKHNTRRVDHPCQLPPHLMYRLFSVFTKPGETILDCFNGAGTTTLTAEQLGRGFSGIELSEKYHKLTLARHQEISEGINPFRKVERTLTAKNSPVPRMPKQEYKVSKKTLQLEVKRIAQELGRLPSRDEVIKYGKYPITYYDDYFASWGEVCAAARTTGMTETRNGTAALNSSSKEVSSKQISFDEISREFDSVIR